MKEILHGIAAAIIQQRMEGRGVCGGYSYKVNKNARQKGTGWRHTYLERECVHVYTDMQ